MVEVGIEGMGESYFTVSAEENGLFIFKENTSKRTLEEKTWEITWLDTALQEVFIKVITLDEKLKYKGAAYSNNQLILLFQTGIGYANNLTFLSYKMHDDKFMAYNYNNLVPIVIQEIVIKDDAVVFGGFHKEKTVVMLFNITLKKGLVLPGFYNGESKLLQINTNPNNKLFTVHTRERQVDGSYIIMSRCFTTLGNLEKNIKTKGNEKINLVNGHMSYNHGNSNVLIGTYSLRHPINESDGIYFADLGKTWR